MNALEIESALTDLFEAPFERDSFVWQFFEAFGNNETTLKRLRKGETNSSTLPGAVLQRNHIHLAVCDAGQVEATLQQLAAFPKNSAAKVKYILATDGQYL